ncbi:LLGL scribble cell polarity complex component 2-like [Morone saxatilis]|uniref:LLGL scribble cell polarity complex component 2-like n=1 Tax=Morone saxatilis TaxID=34816 RepID=UPI0015E212AB|nr:LLGL scribble cell polarity complex component 2-like [Morone saxatilis]
MATECSLLTHSLMVKPRHRGVISGQRGVVSEERFLCGPDKHTHSPLGPLLLVVFELPLSFKLPVLTVEHGFPHQPSALSYSPTLQLLAIGTRSGAIKLYGAPGVEFMGLHDENAAVTQVHFLPHQVELVTLLDDNSLHMWTLRAHKGLSELLEIGRFTLTGPPGAPPSVTRVTAVLAHSSGELLLLGTEGGHVFIVEVPGFRELEERNISLDQVANRYHDTMSPALFVSCPIGW